MLDALGDLALAGAPVLGTFRSYCGGHAINVAALEALFADATAYTMIKAPLPRRPLPTDLGTGLSPAVFAPDSH
jgi:UDP-3-O-[3-hydroxymyristoyl] N-acetylglucosamine deacetylase